MKKDNLSECMAYFKKNDFKRLFYGIREKYMRYERMAGTVVLDNMKESEREAIEGIMQKSYKGKKSPSINLEKLQEAINKTRFEGLNLYEIAEAYFAESFETKRSEQKRKEKEREDFFNDILKKYENTFSGEWLYLSLTVKGAENRYLLQKYNEDKDRFGHLLSQVLYAVNHLPDFDNKKERLPVFAIKTVKNPHFFDEGKDADTLLTMILAYYQAGKAYKSPFGAISMMTEGRYKVEEKTQLLFTAGILKDDISNYTVMYGIKAFNHELKSHKGIDGYLLERQSVHISLLVLAGIHRVEAQNDRVYVIENPAVFAELTASDTPGSFICTSGQLKLSSLLLLDLCAACGIILYYAGDFDPEGVFIAQRLKQRYKDKLKLWHYHKEDYAAAISKVEISKGRVKMLEKIIEEELLEIKECILDGGYAGYQEKLIDIYKLDLGLE